MTFGASVVVVVVVMVVVVGGGLVVVVGTEIRKLSVVSTQKLVPRKHELTYFRFRKYSILYKKRCLPPSHVRLGSTYAVLALWLVR